MVYFFVVFPYCARDQLCRNNVVETVPPTFLKGLDCKALKAGTETENTNSKLLCKYYTILLSI